MWHHSREHEVLVLVKSKHVEEYDSNGQTFIEGRQGSNYEIKLRNRSSRRVCYVVSVDGLSVINGEPAGSKSQGYLCPAWSELTIPGWLVGSQQAAKFEFRSDEKSYSAGSGQGTANTGAIGIMVFYEKPQPVPQWHTYYQQVYADDRPRGIAASYGTPKAASGSPTRGLSRSWTGATAQSTGAAEASVNYSNTMASGSLSANTGHSGFLADVADETALGTGFGASMDFATTTVSFDRESDSPNHTMVLYYDSRTGLKKRGIIIEKAAKKAPPNPFPADSGCKPPPGWQG